MNKGSKYQSYDDDGYRAMFVYVLMTLVVDSIKYGQLRAKHLFRFGKECKRSGSVAWTNRMRLLECLFGWQFANVTELLGLDEENVRRQLLTNISGAPYSVCPKCEHVGDTETIFGFRKVNGRQYRQSYCQRCRKL